LVTHTRIASIILAAGRGTRIGAPEKQKVCLPVDGTPAITRSLSTYDSFGVSPHVLVVGHGAEQVMDVVGNKFENIYFAYQAEQKGTGHATKQGVKLLRNLNYNGDILVVAGDKIIQPEILQQLILTFYEKKLDLAFLVTKCKSDSGLGRVILSESNQPIAIVESIDIAKYTLLGQMWDKTKRGSLNSVEAERMIRRLLKSEKKIQNALEPLWSKIKNGEDLCHVDIAEMTKGKYPSLKVHEELEISTKRLQKCNLANQSIYLFSAPALFEALNELSSNNAQKEEYLTDIVAILAAKGTYKLGTVSLENPHQVMAFNSQKELREINTYLRTKHHPADT
jgi:bifunctional N-acetylglucosamine-1-phosphate-uridyltransferase/glucosamine-1-phosphate-acetyltransferase GlmU-like protein